MTDTKPQSRRRPPKGTFRVTVGDFAQGARMRMEGVTSHVVRVGMLDKSVNRWAPPELEAKGT